MLLLPAGPQRGLEESGGQGQGGRGCSGARAPAQLQPHHSSAVTLSVHLILGLRLVS